VRKLNKFLSAEVGACSSCLGLTSGVCNLAADFGCSHGLGSPSHSCGAASSMGTKASCLPCGRLGGGRRPRGPLALGPSMLQTHRTWFRYN